MFDLIIIGAGPAGLSAAIYAARKKLKFLVLSPNIGGQGIEAKLVENYLGFPEIGGTELTEKFVEHARKFKVGIKEGTKVNQIVKKDNGTFETTTGREIFVSKTIIMASGKRYRELEIPGAKNFEGKGLTYCATCDAPLYKNKVVAVVGAGDAGLDAAWQLADYALKIYIINKYKELRGNNKDLEEKIKNNKKIEIISESLPSEIKGDKFVKSLVIQNIASGEKRELAVDGIFAEIGSQAVSKFLKDLVKLNEKGEIIVDPQTNMSSCPGIFAAGDVTNIKYKQMIIAAGEGAKAALSVYEYLKNII